jgi:penicillin-binding protein 1A
MTHGVTPLEMAAAYSVFANDGIYSEPIMYTKIVDRNGKTVLEKETSHERAISSQAAYIMNDMLQTVVKSGTGTKARLGSMPSAGKTGTTDDHTNGWYVGITPYYAGAVWIGHDDRNYPIKGLVGGTEAPMWRDIMLTAHKGLEVKSFPKTNNIVTAEVCLDSGKAPSEYCSKDSRGSRVIREIFIEGTQPVEICDFHTAANTVPPTETPQNPNPVTPQPGTDENGNTNTDTPGNTTPNGDNGDTPDDNNSGEDNSNNGQTNNNNNNNTNNTQPKGQ